MVWEEALIVNRRLTHMEATRASLFNLAAAAILDKKANAAFKKQMKKMTGA